MSEKVNYYEELSKINVNEHVEKKGKFSYLSWAWAVDVLRKKHPSATWEVIRFNGMPFMETPLGYFVEVAVTVEGITLSQIHPVLDNNNRPIAQPTAFQINTSIQRCLVKAIALHGLGLYIYAGEDLPMNDEPDEPKEPAQSDEKIMKDMKIKWKVLAGKEEGFSEWVDGMKAKGVALQQMHEALAQKLLEKNQKGA
jgi:hypothetical protein